MDNRRHVLFSCLARGNVQDIRTAKLASRAPSRSCDNPSLEILTPQAVEIPKSNHTTWVHMYCPDAKLTGFLANFTVPILWGLI
jgi:hypothetical protein